MFHRPQNARIFWYISLCVIIFAIIFLHFYKLSEIPYGLNVDEVGSAYDAYCIAKYGVDRYAKSYPVYFTNYGDGQNALYTYLTALFFRLFGTSKTVIRMGIALFALAGALFGYLLSAEKWKGKKVPLLFLCLYTILPIFIMTQRFGLESHLMLSASIITLYITMKALETGKWQFYLLAGIVAGISLYTYALMYIVMPVYLLLWFSYGIYLRKIQLRKLPFLLLPLGVLAAPLIMVQIINIFSLPEMHIGPFTLTRLPNYRSGELGFQDIFRNLKQMFTNTILYDNLSYNTIPRYGTLYYFSLPFLFVGLYKSIREACVSVKRRHFDCSALILFWLIGEFVMGCLLKGWSTPNTTRMIGIYITYLYFIASGIYSVWEFLRKSWLKKAYASILAGLYAFSFVSFIHFYFTDYNREAFPLNWLFYETYEEISSLLEEHWGEEWTSRSTCYPFNYVYYLWSYKVNPYEMNLTANGHDSFRGDYINEFVPNTLVACNYVIFHTDQSSIDLLSEMGYTPIETDQFIYFISPLENFDLAVEQQQYFYIDSLKVVDQLILFSGWCIDEETGLPFAEYLLELDDTVIEVEKLERQDVVDVFGKDSFLVSGFRAQLPVDALKACDSFTFSGIRDDGSKEIIYQALRKSDGH